MKRLNHIVATLLILFVGSSLYAQPRTIGGRRIILDDNASNDAFITTSLGGVGINMLNMAPNACAILDLNSQTKGFLPPRMVPAEIAALCGGTPPEGLIVYNTLTHTLDVWNGSSWTGQWQTKGNTNLSSDNVDNLLGSTALSSVKPFNLIVGGTRIMRYEINNRIQGGYPANTIHANATGATIAGGGQLGMPNTVGNFGLYNAIGGGRGNTANGDAGAGDATVGGGIGNTAAGARTTIGGGYFNTANVNAATIGGGANNTTGSAAQYATIGGGNTNTNNSIDGTIGGGTQNMINATSFANTIGGGNNNTITPSAFQATIGGGSVNTVTAGGATIAGGFNNTNNSGVGFIGAGQGNTIGTGGFSVIGGGAGNTNNGIVGTLGGGQSNTINAFNWETIAGGLSNTASNELATIGGGFSHTTSGYAGTVAGGFGNRVTDDYGTVGGGQNNQAGNNLAPSGDRTHATVGGGQNNTASGSQSSVTGGVNNTASGTQSAISGGVGNTASGTASTVAGGSGNTANSVGSAIGGGFNNQATVQLATVGGGLGNIATNLGTVSGGEDNQITAGDHGTISGGRNHRISGTNSTIAGGGGNNVSGVNAAISGGASNTITGNWSAIAGGQSLTLGTSSFGYNGTGSANISGQPNIAYFGNVDVLIGNTDNSAQQLRLYENTASTTLAGADFASFQAPAVMNNTTQYALPVDFGNAGGGVAPYILADVSGAGNPRQLTWISGNSSNWLLNGNSGIAPANFIGTTDAADFVIKTGVGAVERMRVLGAPALNSSAAPLITINNPIPNQQGLRINGTNDAVLGNTLAGNPGVWDLVVNGDAVVSGILKMGGSLWFDAAPASDPHSMKANKKLLVGTTTNNDLAFMTNGTERMYVDSTGRIGIGTKDPVSPLHIKATTPQAIPPDTNAVGFITPSPRHHVLTVENTYTPPLNLQDSNVYNRGNGIAIIIHNPSSTNLLDDGQYNNSRTNYVTFYNDTGGKNNIRGRIEGFSYDDYARMARGLDQIIDGGEFFNPFNWFKFNIEYDPDWVTFDFDFIHINGGELPSLTGGSLPSLSGGSLPSVTGGSLPSVSWCSSGIGFDYPCGFSAGSFPTINVGSFPTLNVGSFPTLNIGSFPTITFDQPVTFNGLPLTNLDNPFSLDTAFINAKVAQIKALPYKEKAADMVMNPVGGLVRFGASFAAGVTYESGSGDYAEWLERADPKEKIGVGDVVGVIGGKISKSTEGTNQYMVATWKPIVLGNMPEPGREADFTKVAFLGQIPVKIKGGCRKGDYILPSGNNDGFARALSPERVDAADLDKVLGVAWDDAYETRARYVKIAVGLKPHEMVTVIQKQQAQIENLQEKISEIELLKQEMAELKEAVAANNKMVTAKKSSKTPKFRYKTISAK